MTELEKIIHEHFAPALDAIVTSITQQPEGDKMVISISEYEKMKATIEQLRKDVSAANSRCATTEVQRNAVLGDNNAMKARVQQLEAKIKSDGQLIDRLNIDLRAATGMVAHPDPNYNKLWKDYTACKNQRDSFRVERDRKNGEIQVLRDRIKELEAGQQVEVKTICVKGQAYSAATIQQMLDVAEKRAAEIETLKGKLTAGASSVVKCGNFHYDASDIKGLLNTIDQLTRENENLRKTSSTILVKGKYMTVWSIEQVMDQLDHFKKEAAHLLVALRRSESTLRSTQSNIRHERKHRKALEAEVAELRACQQYVDAKDSMLSAESRAKSAEDQMYQWRQMYLTENQKVLDLQHKLSAYEGAITHAGMVGSETRHSVIDVTKSTTLLNILNPDDVTVQVGKVQVQANDIPKLTDEVVRLSRELENYKNTIHALNVAASESGMDKDKTIDELQRANKTLTSGIQTRDTTIAAQSITIRSLQDNVRELDSKVKQLEGSLRAKDIENKLIRGRTNQTSAAAKGTVSGNRTQGVELVDGQSYMTTPLGLLPINSEGMRKLSDSLEFYTRKLRELTTSLENWAKS